MYYASVGIIALIVHIIINFELMKKGSNIYKNAVSQIRYRRFLIALLLYYCSDILWGLLYERRWIIATYIDTVAVFSTMVLSVLLWTRSVVSFTNNKGKFGKIVLTGGWAIFITEIVVLIVNFFVPIVFTFDDGKEYIALPARYITLLMQMILYFLSMISSFYIALRSEGERRSHYRTVGFSSLMMAVFIALQDLMPLMPMYSIGCMFATCTIHSFVYSDLIKDHYRELESANKKALRDGLTGVRNKLAYLEALRDIEVAGDSRSPEGYGVVVFDINDLKMTNDTRGHETGDKLIKNACTLICTHFKHSPVFRIGGDEFVALLYGSDYENRESLIEEFNSKIDANKSKNGMLIACGMAVYDANIDESYTDVFTRADKIMYERKESLKSNS